LVSLLLQLAAPPTHPPSLHDALPIYREGALVAAQQHELHAGGCPRVAAVHGREPRHAAAEFLAEGSQQYYARPDKGTARLRHPRDRKSTRLNSSHVKISYAVFCLKKK